MKLKGIINISRRTGGNTDARIGIEIIDELSRTRFLDIEMSSEAFGNAITGLAFQECVFEHRPEFVGMVRELKIEIVKRSKCEFKEREKSASKDLLPHESDGWKGSVSDLLNHRNGSEETGYRVGFIRYVPSK